MLKHFSTLNICVQPPLTLWIGSHLTEASKLLGSLLAAPLLQSDWAAGTWQKLGRAAPHPVCVNLALAAAGGYGGYR